MTRTVHKLTNVSVAKAKKPGKYGDGSGLWLVIAPGGSKAWYFIYKRSGRQREMSLGPVSLLTLAEARERASACRKLLADGRDPLDERAQQASAAGRIRPTFGAFAEDLIAAVEGGWKNEKHRAQWRTTLRQHAASLLPMPIDLVETDHVLQVLRPIWSRLPETASRVRGRIERVLSAATARGLRTGPNPAIWRGHLANLLPPRQRLSRGHQRSIPYAELPEVMERLRAIDTVGSLCLQWLTLTATRSGEARGATWAEIDGEVWSIPAARMKAKKAFRVPLSSASMAILDAMRPLSGHGVLVFPSKHAGKQLSDMTLGKVLKDMKVDGTAHGMRSAFRSWATDVARVPWEVAESCLAHNIGSAVERAYMRSDLLDRRREVMAAWGLYLAPPEAANVVPFRVVQ